eukprot:TRINITY_DN2952_c0_g1_i1.p1 TRINITY_DN2952_c0_g1~~TRINITY_DN2952_c0_g1_i1.p1  ORF type:complete len:227 (-),score=62.50 TRINITY_DN2952_c0_g1_i1:64-744(-)
MIRRPPRSTHCISSAASDVYKRQARNNILEQCKIRNQQISNSILRYYSQFMRKYGEMCQQQLQSNLNNKNESNQPNQACNENIIIAFDKQKQIEQQKNFIIHPPKSSNSFHRRDISNPRFSLSNPLCNNLPGVKIQMIDTNTNNTSGQLSNDVTQINMNITNNLTSNNSKMSTNVSTQKNCLLYTSDAADDMQCVDLGGRRIIKKKKKKKYVCKMVRFKNNHYEGI